ncbi:TonB-dependent siderophore receptor [Thalassotalea sp. 1_MG-2023]|uniref:TonB-dependent siderophore receptor n=1 Tax=Thalassotalea sp. 1_MG-2023 TaxID=3062680 RepID=UPI0026E46083|nr:TonB-dependent siderophore receptor [Thalassotalea sp. 1_MG-2023]MDO6425809.1 TonB-dependent siderophore receptor [Thalassotalea sp. 1_MG-2023]
MKKMLFGSVVMAGTFTHTFAISAEEAIEKIEVTSNRTPLYDTRDVNAAALGIKDTQLLPISIQSFSSELLSEQRARTLSDVLLNDASAQNTAIGAVFDVVSLRGFQLDWTNGLRRDGLALAPYQDVPLEHIERIDVLKGPSGVIAGFNNPGGTINYITKRPTKDKFAEVTAELRSQQGKYIHIDAGGSLDEFSNAGYRVNAAVEDTGNFTGGDDLKRYFFSGAVDWSLSENTLLRVDADFQDKKVVSQPLIGLTYIGDEAILPPYVDLSEVLLGQPWARYETQTVNVATRLDHWFANDWKWITQIAFAKNDRFTIFPDIYQVDLTGTVLSSDILVTPDEEYSSISGHSMLNKNFTLSDMEHDLVFGLSYRQYNAKDGRWFNLTNPVANIFSPVHVDRPQYPEYPLATNTNTDELSYFVTDTIHVNDNIYATVGLRHISYQKKQQLPDEQWKQIENHHFTTPMIGVNYNPNESFAYYLNYSEGTGEGGVAVIGSGALNEGETLPPQESEQIEAGIKWQRESTSFTAAIFKIEKKLEYHNKDTNFFTQDGKQEHQGIELNINGEVLTGMSMVASVSYLDAKLTSLVGNQALNGNQPANVAKFKANAFIDYQLQHFHGLNVQLGAFYVGKRQQNVNNTLSLPSYLRVDVGVKYQMEHINSIFRVKVENVFDKAYWSSAGAKGIDWGVMPGRGRTVMASYTYSF